MSERQSKLQMGNISKDIIFSMGLRLLKIKRVEGNRIILRQVLCLQFRYLSVWLSGINRKNLNKEQYKNIIDVLNWSLSSEFDNFKTPTKIYSFESELRDEIYGEGCFNDIKITGKEIVYDFGRVDLEGNDLKNNKYIIELKRYKDYKDVIKQCKDYKEGFKRLGQDIHIIICQYDCSDIKDEAFKNGFECYEYKRQLTLDKVG